MEMKSSEHFQELETFETPYEPLMSAAHTKNNNIDIEWKAATASDLSIQDTIRDFAVDEVRNGNTVRLFNTPSKRRITSGEMKQIREGSHSWPE